MWVFISYYREAELLPVKPIQSPNGAAFNAVISILLYYFTDFPANRSLSVAVGPIEQPLADSVEACVCVMEQQDVSASGAWSYLQLPSIRLTVPWFSMDSYLMHSPTGPRRLQGCGMLQLYEYANRKIVFESCRPIQIPHIIRIVEYSVERFRNSICVGRNSLNQSSINFKIIYRAFIWPIICWRLEQIAFSST